MKRSILPTGMLTGAGKWLTLALTTTAAVVGLVVNAKNLGLTAWLGSRGFSFADMAARRVLIAPAYVTLEAVGDTFQMAATVLDERGGTLTGATLQWKAMNPAVAVVDSSGAVVAQGPGSTLLAVTVREYTARAVVMVRQRVTAVEITDTLIRIPEGASARLSAFAVDPRGNRIVNAFPIWTSADTSLVWVDSLGRATARGPGRTTLTAALEGFTDRLAVEVALTPAALRLVSGGGQRGIVGRRLQQVAVVEVLSTGGRPVEGVSVRFAPDAEHAGGDPTRSLTDRNGRARMTWTLGTVPGRQRLLVSAEGLDSVLALTAEADPVAANIRVEPGNADLRGPAGAALAEPAVIRVTDSLGAAVTDVPVSWAVLDQGMIEPLADRTDSLGEARARWTLAPQAGVQRLRVRVGNPRTMPATVLTATALAGGPAGLTVSGGDKQGGNVGMTLRRPIVARVTDRHGNPVPGAALRLSASRGTVPDSTVTTDSAGQVAVPWTLGREAGTAQLEIRAVEGGVTARASATARPSAAANVEFQAPSTTGVTGRSLAKPITALVTDAYGNPVPNVLTTFTVSAGSVSPARVMTDEKGVATARWTLGPAAGNQTVTATVRGTAAKATATVRATAPRR
jgi:hypothetical protein